MTNEASKLHDKLLNKYETQYNKPPDNQKKIISVLNKPEMLSLNFTEDDFPPMPPLEDDDEPEKTIAERVKLNPRKKKQEYD